MKKLFSIWLITFLLASNVFAYDLKDFVGTWTAMCGPSLTISLNDDVLHIEGVFAEGEVLSEGKVIIDGIPYIFSSGSFDSETFIITALQKLSSPSDGQLPDLTKMLSLKVIEPGVSLRIQLLSNGFSSEEGLFSEVFTFIANKQESFRH